MRGEEERTDVLVSGIRAATTEGRTGEAVALATALARVEPATAFWCDYVIAGCHGLDGAPEQALRRLLDSERSGGWWAPALLDDASLSEVWQLPEGSELRARAEDRWAERPATPEPSPEWITVPEEPDLTVVTVHGNGPLPRAFQAGLWRRVPWCRVLAACSPVEVAPETAVWSGREAAMRTVSDAVDEAGGTRPSTPVVVVGLGAGAVLAARTAVERVGAVAGAIAVAPVFPARGPYGDTTARTSEHRPSVLVLSDGTGSVDQYSQWAAAHGVRVRAERTPGLGHAFPRDFGPEMRRALDWVTEEQANRSAPEAAEDHHE